MDRKIVITLDEHLKRLDMKQIEFAELSNLRPATISQLANNKLERIQLTHLLTVMDTLKITDFNQILKIAETEKDHQPN